METWSQYLKAVQRLEGIIEETEAYVKPLAELDDYFSISNLDSIRNQCKTFRNLFRMVVIGKFSAGKSSFINALMGQPSFLPSDLRQSTGVVTRIRYGVSERVLVKFADDSIKNITAQEIASYVKIPSEYQDLSLYDINDLISNGIKEEEIISLKELWEKSDKKTLLSYLKKYPKAKIVKECLIESPMYPEELKGWEIVDTPGFENSFANCTKAYLRDNQNEIDAVVYLHDGRNSIQDQSSTSYFKEIETLNSKVRNRTFYAITHAGQITFSERKTQTEDAIKSLKIRGVDGEHLFFIDSIAQLLLVYGTRKLNGCKRLIPLTRKEGAPDEMWTPEVWEIADEMICKAESKVRKDRGEGEITDGDMARALEYYSGFNGPHIDQRGLLNAIDCFVATHRETYYQDLKNSFLDSLLQIKERILFDISEYERIILEKDDQEKLLHKNEEEVSEKLRKLNESFNKITNKYSRAAVRAHLEPVCKKEQKSVEAAKKYSDINERYKKGRDEIKNCSEVFFLKLKSDLREVLQEFKNRNLRDTPLIDFNERKKKIEGDVFGDGFWGWLKKVFSSKERVITRIRQEASSALFDYMLSRIDSFATEHDFLREDEEKAESATRESLSRHQEKLKIIINDHEAAEKRMKQQRSVLDRITILEKELGTNEYN